MTEAQPITQQFTVEILATDENGANSPIATALAAAVFGWEREFNEEEEVLADDGFLVGESDDNGLESEEDDESVEEDSEDEDEDGIVEYESDSVLNLTLPVNAEILNDIKKLREMDADEHLLFRISYGSGLLVRQFTISPDVSVLLSEGDRGPDQLLITVVADVFDSETIF